MSNTNEFELRWLDRLHTPDEWAGIFQPLLLEALETVSEQRQDHVFWKARFTRDVRSQVLHELGTTDQRPLAAAVLPASVFRDPPQICIFDMDSTLINQGVIDEIARIKGLYVQIAEITEQAMQGKLDFPSSLRKRVALLKGIPGQELQTILSRLSLSCGAREWIMHLKSIGTRTAVVSGGFQFVLEHFAKQVPLDDIRAHQLIEHNGHLSGEVVEPIIDANGKREYLKGLQSKYGFSSDRAIAVGDGANDVEMMKEAAMKVSFCGKPKLVRECNTWVFDRNLMWLKELIQ